MTSLWIPAAVLLIALFSGLILGLPMAFTLGSSAVLAAIFFMGSGTLGFVFTSVFGGMSHMVLVALPLFVIMAAVLEKSGVADALYNAVHQWLGSLRGGLSMATVVICTIIAALSGVAAAGTVTMGLIALPIMLRKGYNKTIAIGPILAGGALGILIPPSGAFIIYGMLTRTSIGRLFAGGMIPGLILSFLYISYIGIRCYFKPQLGPAVAQEERVSLKQKVALSRGLILPILLIIAVLGSIFAGIASVTEAAAIGAGGAIACAAVYRTLNWKMIKEACYRTASVSGMVMWIIFGALCFCTIFVSTGGPKLIEQFVLSIEVSPIVIVFFMMVSYFFLGCVVDELTMLALTIPIYLPILLSLGYDPVWFGVLFIINLQMGALTPPFGYCLFYMRGVAPPGVTMADIYRSIIPFIPLQWIALLLVMFYPQLALWLPNVVFGLK